MLPSLLTSDTTAVSGMHMRGLWYTTATIVSCYWRDEGCHIVVVTDVTEGAITVAS